MDMHVSCGSFFVFFLCLHDEFSVKSDGYPEKVHVLNDLQ